MPKLSQAAIELRNVRLKAKADAKNKPQFPPSFIYLTALGNGAVGNPRCLCVFTDNRKYLFNCGEGTQRLAQEHKIKLSKIEHIFFTYKSWQNLGGFPGLSLTMQDIGVPDITLHGPPDIEKLYPMTQHFQVTKNFHMNFRKQEEGPFEDNCFRVTPIRIVSSNVLNWEVHFAEDNKSFDGPSDTSKDLKRIRLSPKEAEDLAVAYICKLCPKPGQLQLEKCVELGVPCGPMLGVLKNGNDITLENGNIVRAADVVSPPEPGLVFIGKLPPNVDENWSDLKYILNNHFFKSFSDEVVECPNESFLDSLLTAEAFKFHQDSANKDSKEQAMVIVHFTPATIVKADKYQQWMQQFPSETTHLFLNSEEVMTSFVGVHRLQHQLNLLEPNIFPLLPKPAEQLVNSTESLTRYSLRPTIGFDKASVVALEPDTFVAEVTKLIGFESKLKDLRKELSALPCNTLSESFPDPEYPNVLFLGTGSAIPSKVRNVSAILANVSPRSCILMDCGEGTYGQLIRFHGIEKTAAILENLKVIFISHLHADHHMGLMEILLRREEVFRLLGKEYQLVKLIIPKLYIRYLTGYHNVFQPVLHLVSLINAHHLEILERFPSSQEMDDLLIEAELKEINTVFVKHCKSAYGLTFTTDSGVKIVYSGDTMPCERLVNAGKGCHLLIHEASMEDDLIAEAEVKCHSTTSQAIEIGRKMGAKFTLLTHFSQRYAKVPIFNENFNNAVGIAFDNMRVRPSDLPKLPLLIPVLKCMFQEFYGEMEDRKTKRKYRDEIITQAINTSSVKM